MNLFNSGIDFYYDFKPFVPYCFQSITADVSQFFEEAVKIPNTLISNCPLMSRQD